MIWSPRASVPPAEIAPPERRSAGARRSSRCSSSTSSVVEGVATTKAVVQLARQYNVRMPITEAMHQVLFEGKAAHEVITDLMNRQLKRED